jgi:hypothetical protein
VVAFGSNLTLTITSFTNMDLGGNGTPGSDYDTVNVIGNFTANGTLDVSLVDGYSPALGDEFELFDVDGTIAGTFAQINLPALGSMLTWNTSGLYSTGEISVVPEPGAWGLAVGLGAMGWAWRRRVRQVGS